MSATEGNGDLPSRSGEEGASVVRYEEELALSTREYKAGSVRARKRVEAERVEHVEPRSVEYGEFERAAPKDADSGEIETLADGSISIPLFEERLVVTKELIVRERVILRKRTVTEQHRIDAELRKEQIEVEGDLDRDERVGDSRNPTTKEDDR